MNLGMAEGLLYLLEAIYLQFMKKTMIEDHLPY